MNNTREMSRLCETEDSPWAAVGRTVPGRDQAISKQESSARLPLIPSLGLVVGH